jgi:phospholipid/cholesterol/gamma-HCH transport system substrate-binding protein
MSDRPTLHNREIRPTHLRWAGRATSALGRHPMGMGFVVIGVIVVASYLSIIAINGVPFQPRTPVSAALPPGAPLLKDGDEVRIAGRRAGEVRAVHLADDGSGVIRMELTGGPVGRDASGTVHLRGLAGATYVQLEPGDTSQPMPEGAAIPAQRMRSGVELADVVDVFDRDTRRSLSATLDGYGNGLAGRGERLSSTLGDLPPALEGSTPILRAATRRRGELADLLEQARRTVRGLAPPSGTDLADLVSSSDPAFGALAARRQDIGRAIDLLQPFEGQVAAALPEADPVIARLERAARDLGPGVRSLEGTLPALNDLLADDGELDELRRVADAANPVLDQAAPLVGELEAPSAALSPLARSLEPLARFSSRYRREILSAPTGFTRWGGFSYPQGQASGHKAVRFAPVLTCARARDPYPAPGAAEDQESACP